MEIRITPRKLSGPVTPPPSKSMAHRAIIAAALSGGISTLDHIAFSQDIEATLRCMAAMGTGVEPIASDALRIHGLGCSIPQNGPLPRFDCGESGSTLRFLMPVALSVTGGGTFVGRGRLMERPQAPYFEIFRRQGIDWQQAHGTLTIQGRLRPDRFSLPGNVSSQFVTGLLYALPLLEGDSEIFLTSPLESRPYVDMTLEVLKSAGIQVENRRYESFRIPGRQAFSAGDRIMEADWSQAGFWYAACFLDNSVEIQGMNPSSTQGDMIVSKHYWLLARPDEDAEIDVSACPDLLPPLAVMAAVRSGTTRFTNAARLRIKESDRLSTVHQLLTALGGQAEEGPDSLTVHGGALTGGTVDGANDHRIVMAAAIAATACSGEVTILGAEAVNKSYPSFWEEYQRLGGVIHVL